MKKDFCFLNYVYDVINNKIDEELLQSIIGIMCEQAKLYYETKTHKFLLYSFLDSREQVLLKIKKCKNGTLKYEDFQPVFFYGKPIKARISNINKDTNDVILLLKEDKGLVIVNMESFDYKENDEIEVYINWFPAKIELRNNEKDYYSHSISSKEELNIFNIGVGTIIPAMAIIKSNRDDYPLINDEQLTMYEDSFMVLSGNIKKYDSIVTTMKLEENSEVEKKELQLGKVDYVEFKTSYGNMVAIYDDFILKNFFDSEGIKGFKLNNKSIIKLYGCATAIIKVEKTKNSDNNN